VGWNDVKGVTTLQRDKEGSADYRYFPEPDIPPYRLYDSDNNDAPPSDLPEYEVVIDVAKIRKELPALPHQQRAALESSGVGADVAEVITKKRWMNEVWQQLLTSTEAQDQTLLERGLLKKAATLLVHDAVEGISATHLLGITRLVIDGQISSDVPKKALALLVQEPGIDAVSLVRAQGWLQQSDEGILQQVIDQVIADNPQPVADYKAGKEASIGFLVGQVMRASQGQANPAKVQELLRSSLQ